MKQLIVLIATIVLGIAIAVMIMGFKDKAKNMSDSVTSGLSSLQAEFTSESSITK